jgi:hypothetical protein
MGGFIKRWATPIYGYNDPCSITETSIMATPQKNWLLLYNLWAAGRTGLTTTELVDAFADIYGLTLAERSALHAAVDKITPPIPKPPPKPPPPPKPKIPAELIIPLTRYPKWWKDSAAWNINIDGPATGVVVSPSPGYRTYIATIALTVDGETNITFGMGVHGSSGSMRFGGDGGPMGIVIAMGNSPLPCGIGGFSITVDGVGVHVGGFISYYYEKE